MPRGWLSRAGGDTIWRGRLAAYFDPTKSSVFAEFQNHDSQTPGWSSYIESFYNAYRRSGMNWYGSSTWAYFYGDNHGATDASISGYTYAGSGNSYVWDKAC